MKVFKHQTVLANEYFQRYEWPLTGSLSVFSVVKGEIGFFSVLKLIFI